MLAHSISFQISWGDLLWTGAINKIQSNYKWGWHCGALVRRSWVQILAPGTPVSSHSPKTCMGFGQLVILNCPSEGMCAWMIVCLSVLALGQTGNLSMMDPTFCPKIAGIGSSPPGLYKRKRMDGLWKWNENDVYWNTGVWIYNDSHQFHIIYRPKNPKRHSQNTSKAAWCVAVSLRHSASLCHLIAVGWA